MIEVTDTLIQSLALLVSLLVVLGVVMPSWHNDRLERPLVYFSGSDPLTVRQSFSGVQILGGTGAGKTSSSGENLARAMLRSGYGGLVLTAKPDEVRRWIRYAKQNGREDSLILFGPQHGARFNWFDYESRLHSESGLVLTKNLVDVLIRLIECMELKDDGKGGSNDDTYWIEQASLLLLNVIEVIQAATGGVTLRQVAEVVDSLPEDLWQPHSEAWQAESVCSQLADQAHALRSELPALQRDDIDFAGKWIFQKWPKIPEKTRGIIQSKFEGLTTPFLRGSMRELFCTSTTVVPEVIFNGGIVVIDMPVSTYNESGRAAQIVWKYLLQRAALRRGDDWTGTPAFLWADEAHKFLTRDDQDFQTVARSNGIATVYLSQTIQNYVAVLGEQNRAAVDSLLGNLATKIAHSNSCAETNEWFAKVLSKTWQDKTTVNQGTNTMPGLPGFIPAGEQAGTSTQQSLEYQVQPSEFTDLRNGGPDNNNEVDAVVVQAGRRFAHSGKPYLRCTFRQPQRKE